jgi:hypothetical protein
MGAPRTGTFRAMPPRGYAVVLSCLCAVSLHACGSTTADQASGGDAPRSAIERYLREVEPIRRAVNRLLGGADPILSAFAERRIDGLAAASRMDELEKEFATYTVDIAAIDPTNDRLHTLHSEYANTFVLEDSYLSALAAGLADGRLDDLPDTQAAQRAAIIRWRTGLTVLARTARAALPADLQQAGRGEIAPSPGGS